MVGVLLLVLIVALTVGLVVYILTRRRFTDKGKPEVVSERQVVEDSQRGGISNGIHSTETSECVCVCACRTAFYSWIYSSHSSGSCDCIPVIYTNCPTHTHTHTHICVVYAEVIELDSKKTTTEMMSSNPSYMPNTDASINYEEDMYSYIDPEDVRILARNPIVGEDEIKTDQVPTAHNIAYGSAIPQDHSDQVPTADNVAYDFTVR